MPGDTNDAADVFVRDHLNGTTRRVSISTDGVEGDGRSFNPAISADGRYVVFESDASNLVSGDTNAGSDVFVHDRQHHRTVRVSVATNGTQANLSSFNPSSPVPGMSGGYVVAFDSEASNLVGGDTNGNRDVFIHSGRAEFYATCEPHR